MSIAASFSFLSSKANQTCLLLSSLQLFFSCFTSIANSSKADQNEWKEIAMSLLTKGRSSDLSQWLARRDTLWHSTTRHNWVIPWLIAFSVEAPCDVILPRRLEGMSISLLLSLPKTTVYPSVLLSKTIYGKFLCPLQPCPCQSPPRPEPAPVSAPQSVTSAAGGSANMIDANLYVICSRLARRARIKMHLFQQTHTHTLHT